MNLLDLQKFLDSLGDAWPRKSTLFTILLVATGGLFFIFLNVDLAKLSSAHYTIVAVVAALTCWVWSATNRAPRAPDDSMGVLFAVVAEDEGQARQLRLDLLEYLVKYLASPGATRSFSVVELPRRLALNVRDVESAEAAMNISRCSLAFWGSAQYRNINGKETNYLRLSGLAQIVTAATERDRSQFEQDFSEIMPRELLFARENDLFAFRFTAECLADVAQYVVGIATALSGALELGASLLEQLHEKLKTSDSWQPPIDKIKAKTPDRLLEIYGVLMSRHEFAWEITRESKHLEQAESVASCAEKVRPGNYASRLTRGLCHVALRDDIPAASAEIKKCRGNPDAAWRYSEAFIHARGGDLVSATKSYRKAFQQPCSDRIPVQTEDFLHWTIETRGLHHLHYCIGFINFYAKLDYASAIREFEAFLAACPDSHQDARETAGRLILKARKLLDATKVGA